MTTIDDARRKIGPVHLERAAYVYVRQSSPEQVKRNLEGTRRQSGLVEWALEMGWSKEQVTLIDQDQGQSGASPNARPGFGQLVSAVARGEVGIVIGLEVSRMVSHPPRARPSPRPSPSLELPLPPPTASLPGRASPNRHSGPPSAEILAASTSLPSFPPATPTPLLPRPSLPKPPLWNSFHEKALLGQGPYRVFWL